MKSIENHPHAELKLKENELTKKRKASQVECGATHVERKVPQTTWSNFPKAGKDWQRFWTGKNLRSYVTNVRFEKSRMVLWKNYQRQMQDLTKSINNMLVRQTTGNHLSTFDEFSAHSLLVKTFSGWTRVLSGEARGKVEMLLRMTPGEIFNILQKKYGRPELIMDELQVKTHQLPPVESIESFLRFSNTVWLRER